MREANMFPFFQIFIYFQFPGLQAVFAHSAFCGKCLIFSLLETVNCKVAAERRLCSQLVYIRGAKDAMKSIIARTFTYNIQRKNDRFICVVRLE